MIVLGITGSIGMGKSAVAAMLRELGVPVHDSDATVHRLLAAGGAAVAAVLQEFPNVAAADGGVDRTLLGRAVFGNAQLKKKLEDILHPLVRADSDQFIAAEKAKGTAIVALDIPLLFETGGETRVDKTICVTAPADVQRARVLARSGMTVEKFEKILASQMPDAEKRKRADYIVDTGTELESTRAQIKKILKGLTDA